MNKIEKCILDGMRNAHDKYFDMTGYWLHHAPEHFIETLVALRIAEEGCFVFTNASISKIRSEYENDENDDDSRP
jgi:hypothetical protein